MKSLSTAIWLVLVAQSPLLAQYFLPFHPEVHNIYQSSGTWLQFGIKVDSVATLDEWTRYYLHGYYTTDECQLSALPVGRMADAHPIEGLRFLVDNDTLIFKTTAENNETWVIQHLDDGSGNYLEGTMMGTTTEEILPELYDAVKIISVRLKSPTGLIISQDYSHFKVSHSHGLVSSPFSGIQLIGHPSSPKSKHNITKRDVYDIHVGDIFHVSQTTSYYNGTSMSYQNRLEIKNVVATDYNADSSILYVTYDICGRRKLFLFDEGVYYDSTGTESIYFTQQSAIDDLPNEMATEEDGMYKTYRIGLHPSGRAMKSLGQMAYYLIDSCFSEVVMCGFDDHDYYIEGCGNYYQWHGVSEYHSISSLLYFKKGDETWGVPLTCDGLLDAKTPTAEAGITLYPNPASHMCVLQSEAPIIKATILDAVGRQLRVVYGSAALDVADLPAGVYTVVAETNHHTFATRISVMH